MKVYLAYGKIHYDTTDVLGVYLSKEEAVSALKDYKSYVNDCNQEQYYILNYDRYFVIEQEVGGECESMNPRPVVAEV